MFLYMASLHLQHCLVALFVIGLLNKFWQADRDTQPSVVVYDDANLPSMHKDILVHPACSYRSYNALL